MQTWCHAASSWHLQGTVDGALKPSQFFGQFYTEQLSDNNTVDSEHNTSYSQLACQQAMQQPVSLDLTTSFFP